MFNFSLFSEITSIAASIIVFFFAGYFLFVYLEKQKELESTDKNIDLILSRK